jgi:3-methyladenine DNA glycosylase/8-oxoguanine DNA glycosylase
VIVAGGHGAFEPKKLPDYDMTAWEGRGAHYLVGSKSEFEGKRVVIIGGGDSACDWVVNLLDTAERVSLVHRREGFRAHEATVKEVMDAHADGRIDLHVPYQVRDVVGNGTVEGVQLFHSEDPDSVVDVPCDAILLQLGFKTALGPAEGVGLRDREGRHPRRRAVQDVAGPRVGVRRHHHLRRQAQADRDRLRRGRDRRLAGRPPHPARDEDPAEVLDEHGRPGRRRGPGIDAWEHLRAADPVLARLLDERGVPEPRPPRGDVYAALVRAIVGQQLSVRSAARSTGGCSSASTATLRRPEQILADEPDELRVAVGLSHAKTAYLRSLAEHVLSGELELDRLQELSDEEVTAALTAVKGIGEWSADIFLMFSLGRPDVLAVGDLGIRRAVERAVRPRGAARGRPS